MAFNLNSGNRAPMAEINVTPLVDVMLVLLIIFMVTAPMMQEGVQVDLPAAPGSPLDSTHESKQIFITLASDKILINEAVVPEDQLLSIVEQEMKKDPSAAVNIRPDKSLPMGMFVRIMATLSNAGIKNINIVTVPQEKPVRQQ